MKWWDQMPWSSFSECWALSQLFHSPLFTIKRLFQYHSSKASILWHSAFFTVQISHPYMITGKTIALPRRTFVGKVMSLLLNMLSRLVMTFLPRSKRLLISWLQSPSAVILELKKNEVWHRFHCFPIYFPWSDGTRCSILTSPHIQRSTKSLHGHIRSSWLTKTLL